MIPSIHLHDRGPNADTVFNVSASRWLWRPWYAKVWWSTIPVWWIGMAVSSANEPLERFYDSAAAGFLNVLFFPLTALLVLGVGFVRHWIEGFVATGTGMSANGAEIAVAEEEYLRGFEDLNATTDIYDPRSGAIYVGNAISPNNGGRISVS